MRMAWYDDQKRLTHVETYENEKKLRKEVEAAAKRGWTVQDSVGIGGHRNLWNPLLGVAAVFTRTKDKVTVTFVRDARWNAAADLAKVQGDLKGPADRHAKDSAELAKKTDQVERARERAQTALQASVADRDPGEKDLLTALKQLIDERENGLKRLRKLLTATQHVESAVVRAAAAGVEAKRFPSIRFPSSQLVSVDEEWSQALLREKRMLDGQERVARAASQLKKAWERREAGQKKLDQGSAQVDKATSEVAVASPDQTVKAERKVGEARDELTKRGSELEAAEAELARCSDEFSQAASERGF